MRLFGNRSNSGDNDFIYSYGEYLLWKTTNIVKIQDLFEYMPDNLIVYKNNTVPESAEFGLNLIHILPLIRICYNLGHEELLPDRPLYKTIVRT